MNASASANESNNKYNAERQLRARYFVPSVQSFSVCLFSVHIEARRIHYANGVFICLIKCLCRDGHYTDGGKTSTACM